METSVSLLIMTRLKIKPDGPEELVAVLQKRGEFNHETFAPESWPGACQLAVHGKVEPGETRQMALYREICEELGEKFAGITRDDWRNVIAAHMAQIGRVEKPGRSIIHYAIEVPAARLALIRLNASTGGLRYVTKADLPDIQPLPNSSANKTDGVFARQAIAMFQDEKEAVRVAFALFGKTPTPKTA